MRRLKVLLSLTVVTVICLSACPNNCNNHGVCEGGVCKCSEATGVGESGLMYVGADCSERSCPSGFSFETLGQPTSVNPHVGDSGTARELSVEGGNSTSVRNLEAEVVTGIYLVGRDSKIESVDNNIGIFKCYDEFNSNIGSLKLYGRNTESGEYYVSKMFDNNEIPMDSVMCKLEIPFTDLSLYYDFTFDGACTDQAGSCSLKWVGMAEIVEKTGLKLTDGSYHINCDGTAVEFTKNVKGKDIVFEIAASSTAITAKSKCYLLATINDKGVITDVTDSAVVDGVYNLFPQIVGDGIKIDDSTTFYELTFTKQDIVLGENKYGLFECYNRFDDSDLGKVYIYHQKVGSDEKYYIRFEFEMVVDEVKDYRFELIEEYGDISLIYPSKVNSECKVDGCTITWPNMKTILGVATGSGLSFKCINSTNYVIKYPSWAATAGVDSKANDIVFTFTKTEQAIKVPNKDDVCMLLASITGETPAITMIDDGTTSFEEKNVVSVGSEDVEMYVNETTKIQFILLKDNIYYAENINYMTGTVGSLLLCNNGNSESELVLIKKENSKIYVHERNNKALIGSYSCKVTKLLNDYSLINPITVSEDCKEASCTLKWKSMSYFVKDKFDADKVVTLACDKNDGLIKLIEMNAKITGNTAPTESGKTTDVELTKVTDGTIPLAGDICHFVRVNTNGELPTDLKSSDYGKELKKFILLSDNSPIKVTPREKQSNVYEVVNYEIHNSKSYVGRLYCQNGNGKNGNGYLMGKNGDNFYILYDLDEVNNNDNICILVERYNDMSLFNGVEVLGQGNGNGVCYKGKCDIKWTGMNKLLTTVTLADGNTGSTYINGIKTLTSFVCSDKRNNIKVYKTYTATEDTKDSNSLLFSVSGNEFPTVGDKCYSLTGFDGAILPVLKLSDFGRDLNVAYVMDVSGYGKTDPKIYKVKGIILNDGSFSVGILKCIEKGESVGYATVYKRDKENDVVYIKYNFIKTAELPNPSDYVYTIIEKYNDLSLLFTATVDSGCAAASCGLTVTDSYSIIEVLKKELVAENSVMNFVCFDSTSIELKIFKFISKEHNNGDKDLKFVLPTGSTEFPLENTKCYMASDLKFNPIVKVEDVYLYKSKSYVLRSKKTEINDFGVYEVLNMDNLISSGLGTLKCNNKYSNENIVGRMWGIDKSNPKINYISFDIVNPTPEIYNCVVDKKYSDYSIYPPITTPADGVDCTTGKCTLTWERMKPIIEGIKITNSDDMSFKCIKDAKTEYVKLTTTNPSSRRERLLADGDLTLYLNSGQDNVNIAGGYKCYMHVKSDGTNMNENEETENYKNPKVVSEKATLKDSKKVYEISNIEFPDSYGVGSQDCKLKGAANSEKVYFMGKTVNNKITNYFVRFETSTVKVGDIISMECSNTNLLNDLSNYYDLSNDAACTDNTACTLTWTGIAPLLDNLKFPTSQIPNENLKIWCVSGNEVIKVDSAITAAVENTNDIKFTITPSVAIAEKAECHLITYFNGGKIENPLTSDFGRTLDGEGTIPSIDSNSIPLYNGRKMYKVSNVEYKDLSETNIGELKCYDTETNKVLGSAYVMGKDKTTPATPYYLIDYAFVKTDAIPTVDKYRCEVQKKYNDLSLLFDIYAPPNCEAYTTPAPVRSLADKATCEITTTGLDSVLSTLTTKPTKTDLVCYNGVTKKYKVYNYIIESNKLKIKEDSISVPEDHDKCQMLLKHNGTEVNLSKSDFGIKNNIKIDNPDENTEIKVNDNTPKVTSKEEASIPEEMPATGGIIKCYDKVSGEYYGTANVIGINEEGKTIVIYNFEVPDGVVHNPADYSTEISSTRNDFSETNPPKVEEGICSENIGSCRLLWREMGNVLGNKLGLMPSKMRMLIDYDIPVSCANKESGVVTEYKGVVDGQNENNDIIISLNPNGNFPSPNDVCHIIVDGNGNGIPVLESDLSRSIKVNEKGELILVTAKIPEIDENKISVISEGSKNPKGNTEYSVYIKGEGNKQLLGDMKDYGVFVMNKPEGQYAKNILSHLVVGNHITIESADSTDFSTSSSSSPPVSKDCIITSINKNYKYKTPDPTPRLLNEKRDLAVGDSSGDLIGFTVVDDKGKSYSLLSGNKYVRIAFKDCDNSNPDLFCAHEYVECSGVGKCDRTSGECKCYNGFSGSACERMNCPNNCNNHGRCIKINDKLLNTEYPSIFGSIEGSEMMFGCLCDSGYRGSDCSLKECPSTNPERDCSNNGICDYSDGNCKCFDGYYGEACQHTVGTT